MPAIVIITDSDASLPPGLATQYGMLAEVTPGLSVHSGAGFAGVAFVTTS